MMPIFTLSSRELSNVLLVNGHIIYFTSYVVVLPDLLEVYFCQFYILFYTTEHFVLHLAMRY